MSLSKPQYMHVQIPSPAGKLEVSSAWQKTTSSNANTLALICHPHPLYDGTMDNKVVTTVARTYVAKGMHTVRFNFRGVGQSTGVHDHGKGEVDDAETVLNWCIDQAQKNDTPVTRLWLAGFSFGGNIACHLATRIAKQNNSNLRLEKLTLIAPAVGTIDDRSYDTHDLILPKKTHVIYGSADDVVPPVAIAQFCEEYKLTQIILADAVHFFHGRLVELRDFL